MDLSAQFHKFSDTGGQLKRLAQQLGSTERADQASKMIHKEVIAEMRPAIVSALQRNYFATGLQVRSGELLKAVSTDARVEAATAFNGIFISIGAGAPSSVYKRAAAFEYGALYGSHRTKSEHKSAKATAKAVGRKSFAGQNYRGPRSSFFDLSSMDLEGIYSRLFKERMEAFLAGEQ